MSTTRYRWYLETQVKKIPFAPILVLGFLILAVSLLYLKFDEERELSGLIPDVSQNFSVAGQTYTLKAGRVEGDVAPETKLEIMRLAAFYQWTLEDPLFWSPDLELSELKTSVDNLKEEHERLIEAMEASTNLYPVEFLDKWVETANLTKDFIDNPTDLQTGRLINTQKELIKLYEKEVSELSGEIPEKEMKLVGLNTLHTPKTLKADLGKIKENAKALRGEIEKRENCLTGKGECTRPAYGFKKPKSGANQPEEPNDDLLDPELVYQHPDDKRLYQSTQSSGPYSIQTPCFGWNDDLSSPTHYFYVKGAKYLKYNKEYPDVKLATDVYLYKLSPDSEVYSDRQKALQGIEYEHLGSTNMYLCPDLAYLVQIAQLDSFRNSKSPILQNTEADNETKEAEKQFFAEPYPSWEALSVLADYYAYTYYTLTQNPNADGKLKAETLARYLEVKSQLGSFDKVLNWAVKFIPGFSSDFENNKEHKLTGIDQKRRNFYISKNFYGLMFLPFSPSFWRRNDSLAYLEKILVKNAIGPGLSYLNYKEAIKNYSEEEIEKWLNN